MNPFDGCRCLNRADERFPDKPKALEIRVGLNEAHLFHGDIVSENFQPANALSTLCSEYPGGEVHGLFDRPTTENLEIGGVTRKE